MTNRILLMSSLSAMCAFAACTGSTVSVIELDNGSSPVSGSDAGIAAPAIVEAGEASPVEAGRWLPPECRLPVGLEHSFTSLADTEAHITGTWWRCSGFINAPADNEGLELSATQARFLVRDGESLAYKTDAAYESSVTLYNIGLLAFRTMTGGGNGYQARASEDARFMELTEITGGTTTRWARAASAPKPAGPPGSCAVASAHEYTSIADVTTRLTGRWSICSGYLTEPGTTTKGIEFAPPLAYFLVDSGGTLVRGPSPLTVRMLPNDGSVTGGTLYQIDIINSAGWVRSYYSVVDESGAHLVLDNPYSAPATLNRVP